MAAHRKSTRLPRRASAWGVFALLLLAPPCGARQAAPVSLAGALGGADSLRFDTVTAGVVHAYAWDARGPWAIHVLEIAREGGVCMAARKAGPPLTARATTSSLAAGAVAGVNADFFRIPEGTTVGAHVEGGSVVVSPGDRPVFAVGRDGDLWIGPARLRGTATLGGVAVRITHVNTPAGADGLALFDRWYGEPVERQATGFLAQVALRADGRGGTVVGVPGVATPLRPDARSVLFLGAGTGVAAPAPGDSVRWSVGVHPAGDGRGPAREVVGGFPVLLADGRLSPAIGETAETFGPARHPRTAVGYARGGSRLFLVTVDGRQSPYSDGMTLTELAELFLRLGVADALNLDGGGSTTMVVRDRIVNRPSDAAGERPVGNALLVRSGCG